MSNWCAQLKTLMDSGHLNRSNYLKIGKKNPKNRKIKINNRIRSRICFYKKKSKLQRRWRSIRLKEILEELKGQFSDRRKQKKYYFSIIKGITSYMQTLKGADMREFNTQKPWQRYAERWYCRQIGAMDNITFNHIQSNSTYEGPAACRSGKNTNNIKTICSTQKIILSTMVFAFNNFDPYRHKFIKF